MKTVRSPSVVGALQGALEQVPKESQVGYVTNPSFKYLASPEVYRAYLVSLRGSEAPDAEGEYFESIKTAITAVKYAGISIELDPHLKPGQAVLMGPDVTVGITLEPTHEN